MRFLIDATELSDVQLADLTKYLEADKHIADVSIAGMQMVLARESDSYSKQTLGLTIFGAASESMLAIAFAASHWQEIVEGLEGVEAIAKAAFWVRERVQRWRTANNQPLRVLPPKVQGADVTIPVKRKTTITTTVTKKVTRTTTETAYELQKMRPKKTSKNKQKET